MTSTAIKSSPAETGLAQSIAILLGYFFISLVIRLPYFGLPILYYDDGETLYHVYALLNGHLPYRDAYTHHFTGYILPLYVAARIFGYSIELVRWGLILNQAITALGVYFCCTIFFSRRNAFIAGLLVLTAREPFVYSFFPLYQVAACFTFILYFALQFLRTSGPLPIALSALAAGAAFCIDQRGALLVVIPLTALLVANKISLRNVCIAAFAFAVLPLVAVLTLLRAELLAQFLAETWTYPLSYRVASISLVNQVILAVTAHRYLLIDSPILFSLALIGAASLTRNAPRAVPNARVVFLAAGAALFGIVFLGGRDYAYYSIPWLPFLATLALFSSEFFKRFAVLSHAQYVFLCAPFLALALSYHGFLAYLPELIKRNDGDAAAALIRQRMKPGDTVFVFGYRPDILALIPTLSALPFVNPISIHPDTSIHSRDQRLRHIVPELETSFQREYQSKEPTYVVFIDLKQGDADWSPSSDFMRSTLARDYTLITEIRGPKVSDKPTAVLVYRRNEAAPAAR